METMTAASLLFIMHAVVGVIDGFLLHDRKYALHTHAESFTEHIAHTLRVAAMLPIAWLLFVVNSGGLLLWLAVVVVFTDLAVQIWDAYLEGSSRERFGGLSTLEYQSHLLSTLFYGGALSLAFIAKPAAAWSTSSEVFLEPVHSTFVSGVGWVMFAGALFGIVHHLWYCHPKFRENS